MESPQSVVSPLKTSIYPEPEKHNLDRFEINPSCVSKKPDPFLGVLEVYIHQARDIQNICIYHKQDVYAKICLTSNPDKSVTTQTVNGGGQNPVFNENLSIDIPTIDSSLRCEIYMLSRVQNYLQDQLLGFASIPLSDIFIKNGKLEKEFTLFSDDLFHSPAGFVHLSLSYNGALPDVLVVPPQATPEPPISCECDLDKIEFPDPKIANENKVMVSEYFELSSESSDGMAGSDMGAPFVSELPNPGSPQASASSNGSRCTESCDAGSTQKDEPVEGGSMDEPLVALTIEPDLKVVQQDFVDLYMKSMQQFTESLAKMKLPLEIESDKMSSGNSGSDHSNETPNNVRPRVFYGSRAFF